MKKDFRFLKVGNKAIVLKDGDVWVVLYANETKSQEFETEAEARAFASKVGNESIDKQEWSLFKGLKKDAEKEIGNKVIAGDFYDVVMSGSNFYIYKNGGVQIIGPFRSEQEAEKKIDAIEEERNRTGNKKLKFTDKKDSLTEYVYDEETQTGYIYYDGTLADTKRRVGPGWFELIKQKAFPSGVHNSKTGNAISDYSVVTTKDGYFVYKKGQKVGGPFQNEEQAKAFAAQLQTKDPQWANKIGNSEIVKVWEDSNAIVWQDLKSKIYQVKIKKTGEQKLLGSYEKAVKFIDEKTGNKVGNEAPEEMEVKYKGYTITYFPYQKKYMVRHPNEVSGLMQKHFTSVDEAKKAIDKKAIGNAQWSRSYYKEKIDPAKWNEFEREFDKLNQRHIEEKTLAEQDGKRPDFEKQKREADMVVKKYALNNLKRARNAMNKKTGNADVTLWKGNDSAYIKGDGTVQYLESNAFETDRDKFESQEVAIRELAKKGYIKK